MHVPSLFIQVYGICFVAKRVDILFTKHERKTSKKSSYVCVFDDLKNHNGCKRKYTHSYSHTRTLVLIPWQWKELKWEMQKLQQQQQSQR